MYSYFGNVMRHQTKPKATLCICVCVCVQSHVLFPVTILGGLSLNNRYFLNKNG